MASIIEIQKLQNRGQNYREDPPLTEGTISKQYVYSSKNKGISLLSTVTTDKKQNKTKEIKLNEE